MQRILVIGSPGAGKSTLAAAMARRTGLPLIHLDQHAWLPGWKEMERGQWQARVGELIAGDHWIIDGNYTGSLARRLERADTVIMLDYPAWLCLGRVLRRVLTTRGRVRADMAEGCPEPFDAGFLLYIALFRRRQRRRNERMLERFGGKLIRLRNQHDADRFLADLPESG